MMELLLSLPTIATSVARAIWETKGRPVSAPEIHYRALECGGDPARITQKWVRSWLDSVCVRDGRKWVFRHEPETKPEPKNDVIQQVAPISLVNCARNVNEKVHNNIYISRTRDYIPEPRRDNRVRPGDLIIPLDEPIHVKHDRFEAWYPIAFGAPLRDDLDEIEDWCGYLEEKLSELAGQTGGDQCALFLALVGPWELAAVGVDALAHSIRMTIDPRHYSDFCRAVSGYSVKARTLEPEFFYDPEKFVVQHWPKWAVGARRIQKSFDDHRQDGNETLSTYAKARAAKLKAARRNSGSNAFWYKVQDLANRWDDVSCMLPEEGQRKIAEVVSYHLSALKGKNLNQETVSGLCSMAIEAIVNRDPSPPDDDLIRWGVDQMGLPHPEVTPKPIKEPKDPAVIELERMIERIPELSHLAAAIKEKRLNSTVLETAIKATWAYADEDEKVTYANDPDFLFADWFPNSWERWRNGQIDAA